MVASPTNARRSSASMRRLCRRHRSKRSGSMTRRSPSPPLFCLQNFDQIFAGPFILQNGGQTEFMGWTVFLHLYTAHGSLKFCTVPWESINYLSFSTNFLGASVSPSIWGRIGDLKYRPPSLPLLSSATAPVPRRRSMCSAPWP